MVAILCCSLSIFFNINFLLQNEVINIVHIYKSSLYRMVIRFKNPLRDSVAANVIITPEYAGDTQQT